MQHIKVTIKVPDQQLSDVLVAQLAEAGYEGFEEGEGQLIAYIESESFREDDLGDLTEDLGVNYTTETVEAQNWNAVWESNFQPVVIENFCTVRAHFHQMQVTTPYEIVITPKMSFGTGHHATTRQVMSMMKDIDMHDKTVLDFGTGTGVLAILAEMLGAAKVLAIDNDEWSVENALENVERNHCKNITVELNTLDDIGQKDFDVILANINRNILLQYMQQLYLLTNDNGIAIMSGLLTDDKEAIANPAASAGFRFVNTTTENNWIAICFKK